MAFERKIFQIFRAGTHTSMIGIPLTFSALDLERMAAAHSKARRRAPLILAGRAAGMSQRELALKCQLTERTIRKIR